MFQSRTAETNSVKHDLFLVSGLFAPVTSPFTSSRRIRQTNHSPMSVPKIRTCPVQTSLPGVMKVSIKGSKPASIIQAFFTPRSARFNIAPNSRMSVVTAAKTKIRHLLYSVVLPAIAIQERVGRQDWLCIPRFNTCCTMLELTSTL